jgi:hypothetical protein
MTRLLRYGQACHSSSWTWREAAQLLFRDTIALIEVR